MRQLFTDTTASCSASKIGDLRLERNGSFVTFAGELASKVLAFQKKGNAFDLQQEIFLIENCPEQVNLTVKEVLKRSVLDWNILSFNGSQTKSHLELLEKLGSGSVLTSAEKAGLVKPGLLKTKMGISLLFLFSLLFAGAVSLWGFGIGSIGMLLTNFVFWCTTGGIFLGLFLTWKYLRRSVLSRSEKIRQSIAKCASSFVSQNGENKLISSIKDEFLNLRMPMAVVVNNFDALDLFSQEVFSRIILDQKIAQTGLIMWIFTTEKSKVDGKLSELLLKQKKSDGFRSYRFEGHS